MQERSNSVQERLGQDGCRTGGIRGGAGGKQDSRETRKYGGRKRERQDSKSLTFRRQPLTIVFTFNELFCLLTMPATRKVAYSTC